MPLADHRLPGQGLRRCLLAARLVGRLVGPGLARRVAPGVVVALVLLTWLWVALPIAALRRAVSEAGPWAQAGVGLSVVLGFAVVVGPRLGGVLLGPRLAWLRRQPLGGWAWSTALAPWLVVLALPVALPALLWPWPGSVLLAGCWVAPCSLLLLLVSGGARGVLPGVLVALGTGLLTMVAGTGTLGLVGALALAWLGLVVGAGPLSLWLAARPGGLSLDLPGRARTPLGALLRRDLLALLRRAPGGLLAALTAPMLPVTLLWAFHSAGQLPQPGLWMASRVLLALGAPALLLALGRLVDLLGPAFDPRHWPVSPGQRLASLLLLTAGLHLPALFTMVLILGAAAAPGFASLSVSLVSGAVLVASWAGGRRARPVNVGSFLAWAAMMVALASLPGLAGPLASLLAALSAIALTHRRLIVLRRRKT